MPSVSVPAAIEAVGGSAVYAGFGEGAALSLGTSLSSIPLAGLATVGSMGLSALGSIAQGKAASASAKFNSQIEANNAEIAKQNAAFASQEGAANTAAEQQKTRATVGAIKAAQAANGVDVNTGSAVDVRSSASALGELNAINIRSNAARQAYGYQTQSTSAQSQSALDKQQAKYDTESGDIDAGKTFLSQGLTGYNAGNFDSWISNTGL